MVYKLTASLRTAKGDQARTDGQVPAVVYGGGGDNKVIALSGVEFLKLYKLAGESSLIDLVIDEKEAGKVLVQDVQYEPVKGGIRHVDLRRIDMNKPLTAHVELRFVGEAPVVKEQGGTLVTTINRVEVRCLPKDLVSHIDIDLGVLKTFEIAIKVRDLNVPAGIEILSPNAEDLVAKATPALTEEEIKAMEEASAAPVDLSKIEVEGEKEKAEAEAAAAEGAEGDKGEKKEEKKEEKEKK